MGQPPHVLLHSFISSFLCMAWRFRQHIQGYLSHFEIILVMLHTNYRYCNFGHVIKEPITWLENSYSSPWKQTSITQTLRDILGREVLLHDRRPTRWRPEGICVTGLCFSLGDFKVPVTISDIYLSCFLCIINVQLFYSRVIDISSKLWLVKLT